MGGHHGPESELEADSQFLYHKHGLPAIMVLFKVVVPSRSTGGAIAATQ